MAKRKTATGALAQVEAAGRGYAFAHAHPDRAASGQRPGGGADGGALAHADPDRADARCRSVKCGT